MLGHVHTLVVLKHDVGDSASVKAHPMRMLKQPHVSKMNSSKEEETNYLSVASGCEGKVSKYSETD